MRYSWQIFLWEIILIMAAGIIYPERIFAQTPIASPTATLPANTVTVNDGTITRVDFPPETKKPDDKNIIEFLFGAQTGDTLKIPDLITNGLLPRYEQASTNLTQSQVLDSYIDPQTDLRVSGVATFCTDKNGAITKRSSRYISGKDKDNQFSRLNNASGKFSALFDPTYSLDKEGKGNEQKAPLIADTPPPCEPGETGEPVESVPIPFSQGGIGGFLASLWKFFENIFSPKTTTKAIVIKQETPVARSIPLLTGKSAGDTSYLTADEKQKVDKAVGAIPAFLPAGSKIEEKHGSVENFDVDGSTVPLNFTQTKTLENYDTQLLCTVTNKGDPIRPADCSLQVAQQITCGSGMPNISLTTCKLCNLSAITAWAEPDTVDGNVLPDLLVKVIETAAMKFGVPAPSILAAMYHEGAFVAKRLDPGSYQAGPFVGNDKWSQENVNKWIACGAPMPNCNPDTVTYEKCHKDHSETADCGKAIVGTGEIPYWFWGNGGASDPWNAVQTIDPGRTRETISPCNFLDSVFAMTKELSLWAAVPRTPSSCYGLPMTHGGTIASCTSGDWNKATIMQSHIGLYVGSTAFCPDGSMSGQYPTVPDYINKVMGPYNAFSCH